MHYLSSELGDGSFIVGIYYFVDDRKVLITSRKQCDLEIGRHGTEFEILPEYLIHSAIILRN